MSTDAVITHIDTDLDAALARLTKLLAIPSVSTDPAHAADCDAAADWLVADLASIGFKAEKRATKGHPAVVAHADGPGPHVLFYGHYDVQPADPVAEWHTQPFEPEIQETDGGRVIRARGASDDKGQLMTFIEACRAWQATDGALPCKITIFLEGEEESGSPSLVPFLRDNADELTADVALICDTGLFAAGTPGVITQLRGLVGEEVTINGPNADLHSGGFGGPAMNPARVLAKILAALHDDDGRVTLDGFYDGVPELTDDLRAQWDGLGFDAAGFLRKVGLSTPAGERGRTALEMLWSRPTCEINGMWSGYTGAGFKTVLPAKAQAKVSFRLVGDQDPDAVRAAFRAHVEAHLPDDCTASFAAHGGSPASRMATDHPAFAAARDALTEEWPNPAAFVGAGGSIPVAGYFKTELGMDSMLIGFARSDDAIHSPNEKYDVESFHRGTRSWARILSALSRIDG